MNRTPGSGTIDLPSAQIRFLEPMKAKLATTLPSGKEWVYEIKFDGIRMLALKKKEGTILLSRNNKDLSERFQAVAGEISRLKCESAILDGEVVALDEKGRSSFQLLQSPLLRGSRVPAVVYYGFDLLALNGKSLMGLPLERRKEMLRELLPKKSRVLFFSDFITGSARAVQAQMQGLGLEGLIAKQRNSVYEAGRRSGSWIKFKWTVEQEFVIGGYTEPEGARKFFGALLVGYYEGGKFLCASKVGTGFDSTSLASLYEQFQPLKIDQCPFANLPERNMTGRQGIGRAEMKRCHWVRPELVCQVRFTEWTRDGHLRHPVYIGLREDKAAEEVMREKAE
ncbi:MAG: non-homologous end-joining DNA ligase [Verrucomicrobiota bacterium]|nr:non-homologous end-joining DNA ligase [Verrucomicrobiota bacterium]